MQGYVHVYTGNGKGKTTAAFGLALRAAGTGMNVFIGQFIKSERYSEVSALERFPERITCRQYGSGCRLGGDLSPGDSRLARCGLEEVRWVTAGGRYRLVILDEINIAASFGLLNLRLRVPNSGDSETLTVYLSEPAPDGYQWFKYDAIRGWRMMADAFFSADRRVVTLSVSDGGSNDGDGRADGVILDPGGAGLAAGTARVDPPPSGNTGGVVGAVLS